jgi:hypothetical protein
LLAHCDGFGTHAAFSGASEAYVLYVERCIELTATPGVYDVALKRFELPFVCPFTANAAVGHVFWIMVV